METKDWNFNFVIESLTDAHKHSSYNRDEIQNSEICGCFNCLTVFKPQAIEYWIDERDGLGQTSLCPMCGIDAVIGSSSGFPINGEFLKKIAPKMVWIIG